MRDILPSSNLDWMVMKNLTKGGLLFERNSDLFLTDGFFSLKFVTKVDCFYCDRFLKKCSYSCRMNPTCRYVRLTMYVRRMSVTSVI